MRFRKGIVMNTIGYQELFDEYSDGKEQSVLNLLYVSLISSHSIIDLNSCLNCKHELNKMLEGLLASSIDEQTKDEWRERIEKGLSICEKDEQNFRK